MAIIKTLLLQVFLLLELLGAAEAAVAKAVKLTPETAPCKAGLTLACAEDGDAQSGTTVTHVAFFKGDDMLGSWVSVTPGTRVVAAATLDVKDYGKYTCKGSSDPSGSNPSAPSNVVKVDCGNCKDSGGDTDCQAVDGKSSCTGDNGAKKCTCTSPNVGLFPACKTCLPDNTGCATATKPRCDDTDHDNPVCAKCNETTCDAGGNKPRCDSTGACLECTADASGPNKGCDPTSAKPKCVPSTGCAKCGNGNGDGDDVCNNISKDKPKCQTDGTCTDGTTQAPTVTGSSGGSTDDGGATDSKGTTAAVPDSKTSSAGTVTSTACLVIASVVVALMI